MSKSKVLIGILVVIVIAAVIIAYINLSDKKEVKEPVVGQFSLIYKDVEIIPGNSFNNEKVMEKVSESEVVSCAFSGTEKVYTYPEVEITVSEVNGKDVITSVYFINEAMETKEGIKVTSTKNEMISAYGENYENTLENLYIYKRGNVSVSFLVENDVITSIEYTLNTEN